MNFSATATQTTIFRGDIYYADLGAPRGSIQGGIRPVIIIQNNMGNKFSPTVLIAPITSRQTKTKLPTHVELNSVGTGLNKDSLALLEQVQILNKTDLKSKVGCIASAIMLNINNAIMVSLGLFAQ